MFNVDATNYISLSNPRSLGYPVLFSFPVFLHFMVRIQFVILVVAVYFCHHDKKMAEIYSDDEDYELDSEHKVQKERAECFIDETLY